MSFLFNRYVSVTLSKDGKTGRLFENLRIKFEVEKTEGSNPNTGKVSIFNLNDVSVGLVEEGGILILETGYNGIPVLIGGQKVNNPIREILAVGDITNVTTVKQGVDRVTTFEIGDGEKKLNESTTDKSFPPNITAKQVMDELVEGLGLVKGVIKGIGDQVFNNGLTVSGKTKDQIDTLSDKLGLQFSVQDGEVQILPKGSSTDDTAVFLSPENGLIGSPTRKLGEDGIELIALLNPQIRPGRKIEVLSQAAQGFFTVKKALYTGDNKDGDFIVKLEAV